MQAEALLDLRVRLDSEGAAQVVWSLWRMGHSLSNAARIALGKSMYVFFWQDGSTMPGYFLQPGSAVRSERIHAI